MNIAGIDYESIKDGDGTRTVIYVSGCSHNCRGCHNPQTHNPNYGVKLTESLKNEIFEEIKKRPYISGITFSGGDPLNEHNLDGVLDLIKEIRLLFGDTKTIWLYTGYVVEDIFKPQVKCDIFTGSEKELVEDAEMCLRRQIIGLCDVLVDGRYEEDKRDITKKWAGSTNQRCIDIRESLEQNKIVLHCE